MITAMILFAKIPAYARNPLLIVAAMVAGCSDRDSTRFVLTPPSGPLAQQLTTANILPCQNAKQASSVRKITIQSFGAMREVIHAGTKYSVTPLVAELGSSLRAGDEQRAGPTTISVAGPIDVAGASVVGQLAWNGKPLTGIAFLHVTDGSEYILAGGWYAAYEPGLPVHFVAPETPATMVTEAEMRLRIADPNCPPAPWEGGLSPDVFPSQDGGRASDSGLDGGA